MKRRNFLRGLVAAPLATQLNIPLADVLEEAAVAPTFPVMHKGLVTTSHFGKALWPGMERWYKDAYNEDGVYQKTVKFQAEYKKLI